ncbi:MAG: DUF5615 family PIN-like protein [Lentisphaerota bacterium]
MKLLFDQNLSSRLVVLLEDLYPGSIHVRMVELESASDAQAQDLTIVTKDSDFSDRSALMGHPPKIIWLQLGNSTTAEIVSVLRGNARQINEFSRNSEAGVLVLV